MTPLCRDASIHGLRGRDDGVGMPSNHQHPAGCAIGGCWCWQGMERSGGAFSDLTPLWVEGEALHPVALGLELCEGIRIVSVAIATSILPCAEGRSLTFVSIVEPSPLRLCSCQMPMPSAGRRIGSGAQLDMAEKAVGHHCTYNVLRSSDPVRIQRVHRHRPAISAITGECENPTGSRAARLKTLKPCRGQQAYVTFAVVYRLCCLCSTLLNLSMAQRKNRITVPLVCCRLHVHVAECGVCAPSVFAQCTTSLSQSPLLPA